MPRRKGKESLLEPAGLFSVKYRQQETGGTDDGPDPEKNRPLTPAVCLQKKVKRLIKKKLPAGGMRQMPVISREPEKTYRRQAELSGAGNRESLF